MNDKLNNVIPLQSVIIRPRDQPGMNSTMRKLFRNVHKLHKIAKLTGMVIDISEA